MPQASPTYLSVSLISALYDADPVSALPAAPPHFHFHVLPDTEPPSATPFSFIRRTALTGLWRHTAPRDDRRKVGGRGRRLPTGRSGLGAAMGVSKVRVKSSWEQVGSNASERVWLNTWADVEVWDAWIRSRIKSTLTLTLYRDLSQGIGAPIGEVTITFFFLLSEGT